MVLFQNRGRDHCFQYRLWVVELEGRQAIHFQATLKTRQGSSRIFHLSETKIKDETRLRLARGQGEIFVLIP